MGHAGRQEYQEGGHHPLPSVLTGNILVMIASEPWAWPWLSKHIPENQLHGQRMLLDPDRRAKSQKGFLPAVPKLSSPLIHPPTAGGRRKSLRTERHPGPTSKGHKRVLRCFRETAQKAPAQPWGS